MMTLAPAGLFPLRPVQAKALDMMRGSIKSGKKRPQLQLPTGAGKTVIAAHMATGAKAKGNRSAFTVPLLSLIDQTVERFIQNGIAPGDIGVVQADHPLRRPQAPIQICSVQTLARREFPETDFIMVDESHLQHKVIYEWMDECPDKIFVGLSATPWAVGMALHYDELLVPATIKEMIESGDLCKFRAFAPSQPDLSGVEVRGGDYQVEALSARLCGDKILTADVVTTWCEKAEGRPTMLFAVDRAHAAKLHDEFCASGVTSAYVDAFTERDERETVKSLFHRGEIKVVCSVGTMTHGVDWDVRCVSFCRPTKSPILLVQALGRGLRPAPGKDHLLILDHSGSIFGRPDSLGLPTEIGFTHLLGGKKRDGSGDKKAKPLPSPRECPHCKEIVPATERHCPCGYEFRYVRKIETDDGELEEVGAGKGRSAKETWNTEQKARFLGELQWHAAVKGYKPVWPVVKYKDRFGDWPHWTVKRIAQPTQPSYATLAWIRITQHEWAKKQPRERSW